MPKNKNSELNIRKSIRIVIDGLTKEQCICTDYTMIFLTKLGGKQFMLNEDNIETVTQNPDTIVVLSNGHSYIVQESMDQIMESIIAFNRSSRRSLNRRNGDLNSD